MMRRNAEGSAFGANEGSNDTPTDQLRGQSRGTAGRAGIGRPMTRRARFLALLTACLLIHAGILAFLLIEDAVTERVAPPEQEISVEVVVEPPPEQKPEPPEEQAEKEEPKKQPEKEPLKTAKLDEKPATDAPRAVSKEKSEQDAPNQEAKAAARGQTRRRGRAQDYA